MRPEPFEKRRVGWDLTSLLVPADALVYTTQEWGAMTAAAGFAMTVMAEVYGRLDGDEAL
ncbi:MAG: hypothetical protein AB1609_07425 [Bacillota bacterium]